MSRINLVGWEWEACWDKRIYDELNFSDFEIKDDGSIYTNCDSDYYIAKEITLNFAKRYREAKKLLKEVSEFYHCSNKSMGFHIHFSFTRHSDYIVLFSKSFFDNFVNEANKRFAELSDRRKDYCKTYISDRVFLKSYSGDRYYAINFYCAYEKHKTYEFRLFPSQSYKKVKKYLEFTKRIVEEEIRKSLKIKEEIEEEDNLEIIEI